MWGSVSSLWVLLVHHPVEPMLKQVQRCDGPSNKVDDDDGGGACSYLDWNLPSGMCFVELLMKTEL